MDTNTGLKKKRDLVPLLTEAIFFLTELSEDVHKLELHNSNVCSKRVKKKLVDFHYEGPLVKLLKEVKGIRRAINEPYYKKGRKINTNQ